MITVSPVRRGETYRLWPLLDKIPLPYDVAIAREGLAETAFGIATGAVFVAEQGDRVQGFVAIERQEDGLGTLCFVWLAYSSRREAGDLLMQETKRWAESRGLKRIRAHYCGTRLRAFLRRFGFRPTSTVCELEV